MPLPHNSATATVIIDGLGICCFNHRRQFWEVGFIRHTGPEHKHQLDLDIKDLVTMPIDPTDTIRIETIGGISPFKDFPNGFFDYPRPDRKLAETQMSPDEKETFRWAVDLEDPSDIDHGTGHLTLPEFPVTRAFIQNAVFYTKKLPKNNLSRLFVSDNGTTMSDPEFEERSFGKTNTLLAGDITCEPTGVVNVVIEHTNGHSDIIRLEHTPRKPWQITLNNMRSPGHHEPSSGKREQGDFQLYYDAFELDDKTKQRSLWGFPESERTESGRTDCNTVWVGTSDDLDALF
jgi:hypothetical protein